MKILSLNVQNFLRLEALEIVPEGNTIKITGKNDQGKSSALKAIDAALTGAKGAVEQPIHGDALKATIELKLGDGETISAIVTRTYVKRDGKDDLATLTVTTTDGAKYPKPQEFLDKVMGGLSLDPVKFLDMKPEQQAKAVRGLVQGYDFDAAAAQNKQDYEKRTDVNREIKRLEGELAGLPEETEASEIIDVQKLIDKLESVNEIERVRLRLQSDVRDVEGKLAMAEEHGRRLDEEIDILRRQLAEAEKAREQANGTIEGVKKQLDEARAALNASSEPIDTQEIRDQINEAQAHNEAVRAAAAAKTRRDRLESELKTRMAEAKALTDAMADRDAAAATAIREAKLPIEGLSFTDDTVLLNGYPFSQASFSKRLMTAVAIAAAHAPNLRLVRIEDGDKLDDESQAALAAFAEKHDLQVWMETVQHGEPVGFVIEDGKLKGYVE